MKKPGLKCDKFVRKSRYKSYKGTVEKVAKKLIKPSFPYAKCPQKVVTDVTEFKCANDEKLYLSPIMDLYNGENIGFIMSKSPTLDFMLNSLKQAISLIKERENYRTTIHSDQGCHYQHKAWVKILKQKNIFQKLQLKATCADNVALENYFGVLKQKCIMGNHSCRTKY